MRMQIIKALACNTSQRLCHNVMSARQPDETLAIPQHPQWLHVHPYPNSCLLYSQEPIMHWEPMCMPAVQI